MNKISLIKMSVIVLLLAACGNINSDKVAQTEIFTGYEASYSEDNSQLTASAWFTVGSGLGTFVNLDNGSSVSFNGVSLGETSSLFRDISYDFLQTLSATNASGMPLTFVYKDNNGNSYSNTASLPARIAISGISLDGTGAMVVNWNTNSSLTNQESIRFTLSNRDNSKAVSAIDSNGFSSGQAIFSAADLASLSAQSAYLQVCRTQYLQSVQAPSVGGSFSASYCSASQVVNLVK